MAKGLELTREQQGIADVIRDYAGYKLIKPYIAISGYAGTGKTTLMGVTASEISKTYPAMKISYLAPTGKASFVLHSKLKQFGAINGNSYTGTIHSYIYRPYKKKDGDVTYHKTSSIEADLLVVDEASMIQAKLFKDIMSFNIPTIFIGDPEQLPPVNDSLFKPLQETQYCLKEVHRQAMDNPIIRVATGIRMGDKLPKKNMNGEYAFVSYRHPRINTLFGMFMAKSDDDGVTMLCGMNRTRSRMNRDNRRNFMRRNDIDACNRYPLLKGEKVICLRNSADTGLRNGQLLRVKATRRIDGTDEGLWVLLDNTENPNIGDRPLVAATSTLGKTDSTKMASEAINTAYSKPMKEALSKAGQEYPIYLDYGYALSVHKAQGSEWDTVLLIDERNSYMTDEDYRRWLYTGITRAKKKLCIIGD